MHSYNTLAVATNPNSLTKVSAFVNTYPVKAIIDTASTISICSSKYIISELIFPLEFKVRIISVTNTTQDDLGWSNIEISFVHSDKKYHFSAYVIPDFKFDLLLETDFFLHFKVDILYGLLAMQIENDSVPFLPITATATLNKDKPANQCQTDCCTGFNIKKQAGMGRETELIKIFLPTIVLLQPYSVHFVQIPINH